MNEAGLSPATRKLLEAAKSDVPTSATRARMWAEVSGVVGGALGAAGTTASVMRGGAASSKVLTVGSLFGGTLTVGLAAFLLTIGTASEVPQSQATNRTPTQQSLTMSPLPPPAARESVRAPVVDAKPPHAAVPSAKPPSPPVRITKPNLRPAEDSLAREASLVSEARGALEHGNPELALRAIRAARALHSRQLVPEELAVEEQALRALGHSDEANGIDVQLRLQYPESALAR